MYSSPQDLFLLQIYGSNNWVEIVLQIKIMFMIMCKHMKATMAHSRFNDWKLFVANIFEIELHVCVRI